MLKPNYSCLLRYGVETSQKQSFIACIADIYKELVHKFKVDISIIMMKKIIINALNIDNFISYNNGNLVQIFKSKNLNLIFKHRCGCKGRSGKNRFGCKAWPLP